LHIALFVTIIAGHRELDHVFPGVVICEGVFLALIFDRFTEVNEASLGNGLFVHSFGVGGDLREELLLLLLSLRFCGLRRTDVVLVLLFLARSLGDEVCLLRLG